MTAAREPIPAPTPSNGPVPPPSHTASPPRAALPAGQVLVAAADPEVSALVAFHLARASYRVRTVATAADALRTLERDPADLVVVDAMLEETTGEELVRALRGTPDTSDAAVVLLAARDEAPAREAALRAGADDCVSRRFSPGELLLRVEAVLRRLRRATPPVPMGRAIRSGPIAVDLARARVQVDGRRVEVSSPELRLLVVLMERAGRVCDRDLLVREVWDHGASVPGRTVDMHVQRLRRKLGGPGGRIETVRGFGYRLRAEPDGG